MHQASVTAPAEAGNLWDFFRAPSQQPCEINPVFFRNGGVVCTEDLLYVAEQYQVALAKGGDDGLAARMRQTIAIIDAARSQYPQACQFVSQVSEDRLSLRPYDWALAPLSKMRVSSDVVIVGAELPSLTTAIEAADQGFSVTVVYAGPLGGISADTGANMRFFDIIMPTSHPEGQLKLFRDGLQMSNFVSIPPNTDGRLRSYFASHYADKIRFVQTHSYDSLNVSVTGNRLANVVTSEGMDISGQYFIDTDPESRVAEKSGIPMDIVTPELAYGLVFDVRGLTDDDLSALASTGKIQPNQIMQTTGVTLAQVCANHYSYYSYHLLQQVLRNNKAFVGRGYRLGYDALAQAFDFMMQCKGVADPDNAGLRWLNTHRNVSGFNISLYGNTGTFNSISYSFPVSVMQYSHNVLTDERFEPIRAIDMPAFADYLHSVTGDDGLQVRVPQELYVRKSTAFFQILHPYHPAEFNRPIRTKYYTYYPMDLRGLHRRDPSTWPVIYNYTVVAHGKHFWGARATATETQIGNLFLINKNAVTPAFSGGQRILGNQINMGAALIAALPHTTDRVGTDVELVHIIGTVLQVDSATRSLLLMVQSFAVDGSQRITLSPTRPKRVTLSPESSLDSLGPRKSLAGVRQGDRVAVDGWDHGIGTKLWAITISSLQ